MSAYMAFTKKEFTEFTRTYKLLILGLVFLLFGVMSPLTAKFTPELISQFMPEGIEITLSDPTAMESWAQFYKNVSQLGLFVVVILFSGMMASEYSHGTLIHLLTKGLPRKIVILSKFTSAVLLWTGAYLICFVVCLGYTWFYWRDDAVMNGLFITIAAIWGFGVLLLSVTALGSVLFKSAYGNLLFTGVVVVAQFLLNIVPAIKKFSPLELIGAGSALLQGQVEAEIFVKPMVVTGILCVCCVIAACIVFDRKKL